MKRFNGSLDNKDEGKLFAPVFTYLSSTLLLSHYHGYISTPPFQLQKLMSDLSTMDTTITLVGLVALIFSMVACVCVCVAMVYFTVELRRIRQMIRDMPIVKTSQSSNSNSLPIRNHLLPLTAQPGESITELRRPSGPPLPPEFVVNTEEKPEQTKPHESNTTEKSVEHYNEGFENSYPA